MSGTKQNQVWPCRPVNWYAGWPGQAPVKHGRTVLGSSKHVHLDVCAAFPVRSSLSFYSSSRNCLVGTRVELVVYVHNRHLQLRGNAAILIKPFSFFTSFKSELKQNIYIYILDWEMCRSSSVDPLRVATARSLLTLPLYGSDTGGKTVKQNENKTTNTTPATGNINLLKLLGGGGAGGITVWHRASVRRIHIKLMFIYHSLWLCVLYF